MKYEIIGGDSRFYRLAKLLEKAGNEVSCWGLEKAADDIKKCDGIESADCYILPLPVEKRAGELNAPLSETEKSVHEILFDIPDGSLVLAGKMSTKLRNSSECRGLEIYDYMQRTNFTVGNAALTAEAALWLLMNECETALCGKKVLVIGYGRIGRILAHRLKAMNMNVGVMSRNPEQRAIAGAIGFRALSPKENISGYDFVINTAPGAVLPEGALSALEKDACVMELASAPGGIGRAEAAEFGLKYIAAPGLPGRYSPESAAKLIFDSITEIIKERENGKA